MALNLTAYQIQWNLDLTKSLGTGQICSLNGGFVISRFFSIHFTVTLAGDIEIISFVISRTSLNRGSLNRGSTVTNMYVYSCGGLFESRLALTQD